MSESVGNMQKMVDPYEAGKDPKWRLALHLSSLYGQDNATSNLDLVSAAAIVANPQAHIDALVAAGVLELTCPRMPLLSYYRVARPHSHDWRFDLQRPNGIICADPTCRETSSHPSRTLADLPKYDGEIPA